MKGVVTMMSVSTPEQRPEDQAGADRTGRATTSKNDTYTRHRLMNLIAIVRSILRRTQDNSHSLDDFIAHFEGRFTAIARYQGVMARGRGRSVDLEEIVRDELVTSQCLDTGRCTIVGPPCYICDDSIEVVALAVHELATNAVKYGALSQSRGTLQVRWTRGEDGALHFAWSEGGVSMVAGAQQVRGFGRHYVEEGLVYQLGATTAFTYRPGGILCEMHLPAPCFRIAPSAAEQDDAAD